MASLIYGDKILSHMAMISIKGHEFNAIHVKDSFNRRALKFKNNIHASFRAIGLGEDEIEVELEPVAIKNLPASASWWMEGYHCHYSYQACTKYVENLYVVSKLIEFEILDIVEGRKTTEEFIKDFTEEKDVKEARAAARKLPKTLTALKN